MEDLPGSILASKSCAAFINKNSLEKANKPESACTAGGQVGPVLRLASGTEKVSPFRERIVVQIRWTGRNAEKVKQALNRKGLRR